TTARLKAPSEGRLDHATLRRSRPDGSCRIRIDRQPLNDSGRFQACSISPRTSVGSLGEIETRDPPNTMIRGYSRLTRNMRKRSMSECLRSSPAATDPYRPAALRLL